jgi:hypothetical protein
VRGRGQYKGWGRQLVNKINNKEDLRKSTRKVNMEYPSSLIAEKPCHFLHL